MILDCNYEELRALEEGARVFLEDGAQEACAVAAPPARRARVEAFLSRLDGPIVVRTLVEQRVLLEAVDLIVSCLRAEMETLVTATHPASEGAVAAYFDFAHALSVQRRVQDAGAEMRALIELVTGAPATDEVAETFVFPD